MCVKIFTLTFYTFPLFSGTKLKDFKAALEKGSGDFPELVTLGEDVKKFARTFPTIGFEL